MSRPKLVMSHLALLSQLKRYSDEDLALFAKRLGRAGYDYVRVFWTGWGDGGTDLIFPYVPVRAGYDLTMFDDEYLFNMKRLMSALHVRDIGLYADIYDQCSVGEYWDCWKRNNNNVWGWWDMEPGALEIFTRAVRKIMDCARETGCAVLFGLGNELKHPDDDGVDLDWVRAWAWPRINALEDYQPIPIPISASGRTGHKLLGYCGTEDDYFPEPQLTMIIHGIGMTTHVPPNDYGATTLDVWLAGQSVVNPFGWSDDGVHTGEWNLVPEGKRGPGNYDATHGGERPNWPANTEETIKCIQVFKDSPILPLTYVDVLPREISDRQHIRELTDEAVERGPEVMRRVYGENPARPPMNVPINICKETEFSPNPTCPPEITMESEDEPERPTCPVDHTPPDTRTCWEKYCAGRPISKWQILKYIKCILGIEK